MRLLCMALVMLGTVAQAWSQSVVTADPARPREDGGVTITYRPDLDERNGEYPMTNVTEVWAYTGAREAAIAQDPNATYYEKVGWNDLKNSPEMQLTNNGDGTYTLVIENIRAFYNVPDDRPVRELLFVFRNADGTVQGSDRLVAVDPAGGASTAGLRLINGVATSTAIDIVAAQADEAQITEIGFQLASVYKEVPSGDAVNVKAKASGAPAPIYADLDANMATNGKYTLLVGESGDEYTSKFLTDGVETADGITKLRFVHWSPATPAVDVLALLPTGGSAVVIANASYGDVVEYMDVPAGTYKLAVAAAGSSDPLITFNAIDLPGNTALTVVAFGDADALTRVRAFIDNGNGRDFVDLLPLGEGWVVKADPVTPSATTEGVTITYNPENDVKDGQFKMVGVEEVFVYTGARDYSGGYFEKAGWGDVGSTDALKLTKNADGTFSWTIPSPIADFYPGAAGNNLKELLMVFRNADGTAQGSDVTLYVGDGTGDIATTEPGDVTAAAPVSVTYFPWNDRKDGEFKMVGVSDVYVYTGGICEDGTYLEKAGWGDVGTTPELMLTSNENGTATWNVTDLNAFYNVPADKKLKELLLVFRNAEGTKQGVDVKIPVDQTSSVEDDRLAAAIRVFPNPSSSAIQLVLPEATVATITIVDAMGSLVSTLSGEGVMEWNGRTTAGASVAPGTYYVQFRTATATAVTPVTIIR